MIKMVDKISLIEADKLIPYVNNPKQHPPEQIEKIASSIKNFGFTVPIIIDNKNEVIAGHGRLEAAKKLELEEVPVIKRDDLTDAQARALRIADNKVAETEWDLQSLNLELEQLEDEGYDLSITGFDELSLEQLDEDLEQDKNDKKLEKELDEIKGEKPNPRDLPLDFIFTHSGGMVRCCIAVEAGLKYGFQSSSSHKACPQIEKMGGRHDVTFIDNDYFEYDHEVHLEAVKEYEPKYATVRDVMTRQQCNKDDISYYSLEQILEWAEELDQYAENVIVIPKYDCIDEIPEKFMLGYSVPTSHGGTPLPAKLFEGRKVHILGGSWKRQLEYLSLLGDDVVSIDNNMLMKKANWGSFVLPNGDSLEIIDVLDTQLTNPAYVAFTISVGCIAAKINELFAEDEIAADTDTLDEEEVFIRGERLETNEEG